MNNFHTKDHISDHFFVTWYYKNGRDFPWRCDNVSPYQILVTELLLHQTQALQVSRVWKLFFKNFPDVEALHKAEKDDIFKKICELGFGKQRTRKLKSVASHILEEEDGIVPSQESKLLNIPGVGSYTAAAVQCFAFGKRVPLVDTNIMRIAARLEGRSIEQRDVRRNEWVWEWAQEHLPERRFVEHNYGILDFGALICTPHSPTCSGCALLKICPCGHAVEKGESPPYP